METAYLNTDLILRSPSRFDVLRHELDENCCVLYYECVEGNEWVSAVESVNDEVSIRRNAELDIRAMLEAICELSPDAKAEFDACCHKEFNIGFECWDTWAFAHSLDSVIVTAVAEADCSIAVTLYPMRQPDGTPRD